MNEIQRFYFGSQASPVPNGNAEAGAYTLYGFSADATGSLAYNDINTAIQTALEALTSIGSGNVAVSTETNGFTIEFQGSLANTNVNGISQASNSLKQKADTISVTNTQNGAADQSVTPSNSTTTSAVSPVDEVQQVSLGGATTGTFDLNGTTGAQVSTLDTSGIQAACNSIWGSGNTTVADIGSGNFSVTFQSALGGTNVGEMSVSNNATDGSPSVSTTTSGVAGVHQQDTCSFSPGSATGGAMTFDGQSLAYNVNASGLSISGATASGTPESGTITTTWSDYSFHSPVMVSSNTLQINGQPQIVRVQCTDSPTEGQVNATFNGNTSFWDYSASSPTAPSGFTLTSGAANDWTFTASANASNVTCTADDSGTALRKDLPIEIVTVQEGSGGGGGSTGAGLYYRNLLAG